MYEQPPLANIMSVVQEYDSRMLGVLMGKDQFQKAADEQFVRQIADKWGAGPFPGETSCLEKGLPGIYSA